MFPSHDLDDDSECYIQEVRILHNSNRRDALQFAGISLTAQSNTNYDLKIKTGEIWVRNIDLYGDDCEIDLISKEKKDVCVQVRYQVPEILVQHEIETPEFVLVPGPNQIFTDYDQVFQTCENLQVITSIATDPKISDGTNFKALRVGSLAFKFDDLWEQNEMLPIPLFKQDSKNEIEMRIFSHFEKDVKVKIAFLHSDSFEAKKECRFYFCEAVSKIYDSTRDRMTFIQAVPSSYAFHNISYEVW